MEPLSGGGGTIKGVAPRDSLFSPDEKMIEAAQTFEESRIGAAMMCGASGALGGGMALVYWHKQSLHPVCAERARDSICCAGTTLLGRESPHRVAALGDIVHAIADRYGGDARPASATRDNAASRDMRAGQRWMRWYANWTRALNALAKMSQRRVWHLPVVARNKAGGSVDKVAALRVVQDIVALVLAHRRDGVFRTGEHD